MSTWKCPECSNELEEFVIHNATQQDIDTHNRRCHPWLQRGKGKQMKPIDERSKGMSKSHTCKAHRYSVDYCGMVCKCGKGNILFEKDSIRANSLSQTNVSGNTAYKAPCVEDAAENRQTKGDKE